MAKTIYFRPKSNPHPLILSTISRALSAYSTTQSYFEVLALCKVSRYRLELSWPMCSSNVTSLNTSLRPTSRYPSFWNNASEPVFENPILARKQCTACIRSTTMSVLTKCKVYSALWDKHTISKTWGSPQRFLLSMMYWRACLHTTLLAEELILLRSSMKHSGWGHALCCCAQLH